MEKEKRNSASLKKRYKKPTVIKSFSEKELGPWVKRPGNMWDESATP